ncbi:TRAP transporter large permease [Stappia taiwanensis]|uniref:TRAP transporter large permease protein n=1 Tax=Stappia taiwanensis TaxID=992267 RepID=A0A838Y1T3_9HYPH|nr:TRAP transporter large permease [Stappia taiwanensis]MBA4612900.1 TRAP transporter large permease [Stappia taiwanensis]GGF06953.1 ABC transporter permease [Stappia taiwanensis]
MGLMFGLWMLLLLLGMSVALTLGVASMVQLWADGTPMVVMAQRMTKSISDSFPLLAVPFFIFAGNLMNSGGVTERIFTFARVLVGHFRGGLGHVNVLASVIFSGMSGSALADAGGLGNMEIKAMRSAGYDAGFSGAVTVASCVIGPMIPPSIPMVLYGVLADVSIGRLFLGGVVPGLLTAGALMAMIAFISKKRDYPRDPVPTLSEVGRAFKRALLPIITPGIIIAGIAFGFFSPTEAAVVASLYALVLSMGVYREMTWRDLQRVVLETVRMTAMVCLIVATASVFAWILAANQAPMRLAGWLLTLSKDPLVLLLVINAAILIAGFFIEGLAIMILVVPALAPTLMAAGIDPVHFGVVFIFNLMIGLMTPPMGVGLFVVSGVSGIRLETLARASVPFLLPLAAVLLLLMFVPQLVTWLPDMVLGPQ